MRNMTIEIGDQVATNAKEYTGLRGKSIYGTVIDVSGENVQFFDGFHPSDKVTTKLKYVEKMFPRTHRVHDGIVQHRHFGRPFWHPLNRIHDPDSTRVESLTLPGIYDTNRTYHIEIQFAEGNMKIMDGETYHRHGRYNYWHPVTRIHKYAWPADGLHRPNVPPKWQQDQFDWSEWEGKCEAPLSCNCLHETENSEIHHKQSEFADILGEYWTCPKCGILNKIRSAITRARIESISPQFYRRGCTFRFLKTTSVTFIVETRPWRVWALTFDSPPVAIPLEWEEILFRRLKYKLTKGAWTTSINEGEWK